ncbi:MAG: aminotransferase class I/II-fold pyridoxal phosphate-dependent enzyme [Spirochaetales bacterium]|nr:aminotransferase class I/II-fold pyridoxal phosphate-dependent enzyme [Spirochaetales bacterium]
MRDELQKKFDEYKALGLSLNMQRGQPADENFDLSNPMLTIAGEEDMVVSGVSLRNYPGGVYGIQEARELFGDILKVKPEEVLCGNNSSLKMLSNLLMWALLKGMKDSPAPWVGDKPKMIVTVPGYDRHFLILETLGFELVTVPMGPDGPDMDKVESLVATDSRIKGILFVPTYSNPTGDSISLSTAERLASMECAAPDFTIFADDAYGVHHVVDNPSDVPSLIRVCEEKGNRDRTFVFGSTSKITFAGAGIAAMASSPDNLAWFAKLLGTQFIGPNKIELYRHVKFIRQFPGGLQGLMRKHAELLKPKFDAVEEVLERELGGTDLARWTVPHGGYFVSLDTTKPVADKVIELAREAGVALTPAGATFPGKNDPNNSNIRLAPSRPPLAEVVKAMEIVALCIKLASE